MEDTLWIFKKPEMYPAGLRPDVRTFPLLDEGENDRGAAHRRTGYPSDFGMSAASRRRAHMGTEQSASRSATHRNPDSHRLCRHIVMPN